MKSFFEPRKNNKVKPIESYNPRERYQADIIILTLYGINLNIFLQ